MYTRRFSTSFLLSAAMLLPAGTAVAAAPGALDPSFGSSGRVTASLPSDVFSVGTDVLQQVDGKLVLGGYRSDGSATDMGIARFNSDGSLDTSFSDDGLFAVTFSGGSSRVQAMAMSGNKIVAAGWASNGSNSDFAVRRLSGSGNNDSTFGSGGVVTTAIGVGNDAAYDVIVRSDGRLVAAGYTDTAGANEEDFALVGYTASGALDNSFGSGGKVQTNLGGSDVAYAMLQQPDGNIVVAGYSAYLNNSAVVADFALVRYSSKGVLDNSFSQDGRVTTAFGNAYSVARGLARQRDGKLVAVGCAQSGGQQNLALVRYTSSGTLDSSFGNGGKVLTSVSSGDDCGYSVIQQFDGKLLVAGYAANGGNGDDFMLVRYLPDGTLDTAFGSSGVVTTAVTGGSTPDRAYAAIEQADGQVVAAGVSGNKLALARYLFDDDDNDGVTDALDNCQFVSNPGQANNDDDPLGNACDDDDDNDGVPDDEDAFPLDPTESVDTDGDGIGNNADPDDDNDGVLDGDDPFPLDAFLLNRVTGDSNGDAAGYSVALVGDVDGDGHADILVGAPRNDVLLPGGSKPAADVGSAWLSSGQTLAILATFNGAAKGDQFGSAVAAVGDVDNDGTPDFAIGAPKADELDPVTGKVLVKDRGAVTVYSGATRAALYTVSGEAAGDNFGAAISGAGDLDGDSRADLLVGAPLRDGTDPLTLKPLKDAGAAYLLAGAGGSELAMFEGEAKGDQFGFSVAGGFDLNHDAVADIAIGSPRHSPLDGITGKPRKTAGSAYVYSGAPGHALLVQLDGAVKGDSFGYALAAVDSGADVFVDLLVGAPKADVDTDKKYKDAGRVSLFANTTGAPLFSVEAASPQAGALFGSAVAAAGDVDATGPVEFVVGEPKADTVNPAGQKLKDGGRISVYAADSGAPLFAIDGDSKGGQLGFVVSGGGDHNADGYDDVAAGAPRAAFEGLSKAGVAKVISGKEASAAAAP